ncbi:MAG: amino acid permease [Sedimentisphaerales bacterium]|nr:amino acid permease [Sedimentisphaerales bacterium]
MRITPKRELSLYDSTCIIVGIIIGAGIYQMAPNIAKGALCWWGVIAIWVVGGVLSLFGALGYAELATAYPREGGDYVYLSRAYGRWAGYLFGWGQLSIIRPGDIAVMAFAFATYVRTIYDPLASHPEYSQRIYAAAAVIILTLINVLGVKEGKWTQNLLTTVKALGLLAIVGLAAAGPRSNTTAVESVGEFPLHLALVFVLFTYGGWNEMAYVAAEVKNPRRNIVRALVIGAGSVTVLYVLVNGAFLYTLGYSGLANSDAVATETISTALGAKFAGRFISVLVCISALGAVNGLIFAGARISYALGADHRAFRDIGKWHERTGTPACALLVQGAIAVALILAFGSFVDTILYTAAPVYLFYLATSLSVIVLRRKEPGVERPYRVTGYPFTTIIFCVVCAFLIYSTVSYAWNVKPRSLQVLAGVLLGGMILYWFTDKNRPADSEAGQQ